MAGHSTPTDTVDKFRTPTRILIPKLLKSRDNWKKKCQRRRAQNKTLKITIRDLTASRETWRTKFDDLQAAYTQLQLERDRLQQQLAAVEAERDEAKKK